MTALFFQCETGSLNAMIALRQKRHGPHAVHDIVWFERNEKEKNIPEKKKLYSCRMFNSLWSRDVYKQSKCGVSDFDSSIAELIAIKKPRKIDLQNNLLSLNSVDSWKFDWSAWFFAVPVV